MSELLLLIISSPSGAGKTTLTRRLLTRFPGLTFSVSHTTRRPRATEVDGTDYHFIDRATFEEKIAAHAFAEWAEVHGNLYGTSVSELTRAEKDNRKGLVFDVDYQGARQIKARFPEAVGVFILPPSLDELKVRLRGRASDDEATITRRFNKARQEIEHYPFFDYMIINDDVEVADAELCGIVYAERCRRRHVASKAERLLRTNHV